MTFSVEKEDGIKELDIPEKELFERVAKEALLFTGCPYECEVSLTLTDDERIRELNKEYRGVDKATDVLSFPMLDYPSPGDFSGIEEDSPDCFDPENNELILGDIVISADHVLAQALEYGHSVIREYAFLIAHSMLHLQGFDHMEPLESVIMEKAQEDILDRLEIRR